MCEDGRFDLLIANHQLPDGPACELLADAGPCHRVPGIIMAADDDALCSVSLGFQARLPNDRPLRVTGLRGRARNRIMERPGS